MHNRELSSQLQRLRWLFNKANAACGNDFEMRSHWARYLCVLSAGFLENSLKEIYGEFVRRAPKPVADYATSMLSGIQNPNTTKFIETARRFKPDWATELEAFVDSNGRREAINSIMKNRHEIAHGRPSGITMSQIKDYLDKAVEVIDFIESQCER
ncbi:MAG: hypothetical protein L0229_10455 [Blastocatellia bacterium]|nr:hypothetical protein [Blastocatellia bacterium]